MKENLKIEKVKRKKEIEKTQSKMKDIKTVRTQEEMIARFWKTSKNLEMEIIF